MSEVSEPGGDAAAFVDPLENLLGYWLRRASTGMMADLGAALGDAEVRPTEATILMLIQHQPGLSQSDIGRILGIARANMAPLTAGLMKRGFIQKARVDGRSQALTLTCEGERRTSRVQSIVDAHERRFQSRLAPESVNALIAALRQMVAM